MIRILGFLGVLLLAAGLLTVLSASGVIDPRGIVRTGIRQAQERAAGLGLAAAARPDGHDGQWVADVPAQGSCPAAHMTLFVDGRNIVGNVVNRFGTFPVSGHIDAAGDGNIRIVDFGGRIKFLSDSFAADYFNACGERRAVGKKIVPGTPG